MPKSIKEFYDDRETANNVREFLLQHLEKVAVEKVFSGEDVKGFPLAKEAIENAFEAMATMFEPKPVRKVTNEAK